MHTPFAKSLAKLALPVCGLVLSTAQANNIESNVADFSFVTASAVDTNLGTTAKVLNSPAVTYTYPALEQFDPYYGVLVGATLYMESDLTLTLEGQATSVTSTQVNFAGRGNIGTDTAMFNPIGGTSAAWGGMITLGDFGNVANSNIKCTADCSISRSRSTNDDETSIQSITDPGVLEAYVGLGHVASGDLGFQWNPTAVRANVYSAGSGVTASASTTLAWEGNLTATYTFVDHAYASFNDSGYLNDELTLDFGTVQQGSAAAPLGFDIYNLENEATGLDFIGISASSGDTEVLTTDLSAFSDLLAGDFLSFLALFDTSNAGSFAASYTLIFRDTLGTGARSSQQGGQTLTLNLLGTVVAPVPVPPALWLFGSAIAAMGIIGRRRGQV